MKNTDYLVVDDRDTGSAMDGSAQAPLKVGEQGSSEGPFAAVLGSDPWSELSTPLRPTEVAGELKKSEVHWKLIADIYQILAFRLRR